ncbi:hypothetical protein AB6E04_07580 [Vibrio amylolyticus]|uniref:hypothetical protein n=1 Tax=Vibrio amylolyticus TaxID=2847292 RepID=UPI003554076C
MDIRTERIDKNFIKKHKILYMTVGEVMPEALLLKGGGEFSEHEQKMPSISSASMRQS